MSASIPFPRAGLRHPEAFASWLRGAPPAAPEILDRDDPALRVEQMVLRALSALASADTIPDAVQQARQAARAAYTEGLHDQEFLAYWALARVRRISGNPYAAARILGALCRAAPEAWWPLIDWELVLAGGETRELGRATTEPAASWHALCRAAEAGEHDAWRRHAEALSSMPLPPPLATERDALVRGLEGDTQDLESRWRVAGALHEPAARLGQTPAVWRVRPGSPARLSWCVADPSGEDARLMDEGERVRALAAGLAEADASGVPRDTIFERVYGFAFEPSVHDGIFRVLLHRARGALEGAATIERDDTSEARLTMKVLRPLRLPEPRSEPPFGDRILRAIAANPGKTAKELAERSGTTVRAVQRALRLLLETGACRSERVGRAVVYAVEDTTFSEPTHFGAG